MVSAVIISIKQAEDLWKIIRNMDQMMGIHDRVVREENFGLCPGYFFTVHSQQHTPISKKRAGYTVLALYVLRSVTNIFRRTASATIQHSYFKLGMVLRLGILHVAYQIQVHHLSTSCFPARFVLDSASWDSDGILNE